MTATAEFDGTDYQQQKVARPDLAVYGAAGQFRRSLSRTTGFSIGYQYRTGEFGYGSGTSLRSDARSTGQRLDIGVDYSRALSTLRRAVFRFNVATSSLDIPESVSPVSAQLRRLLGDFSVDYPFRGKWHARGGYSRGLEYVAVLGESVFIDAANIDVVGPLSRGLILTASGRYSTGKSALSLNSLTFDTDLADIRLRYALTKTVGVYGEYLYHFYDFRGSSIFRQAFRHARIRTAFVWASRCGPQRCEGKWEWHRGPILRSKSFGFSFAGGGWFWCRSRSSGGGSGDCPLRARALPIGNADHGRAAEGSGHLREVDYYRDREDRLPPLPSRFSAVRGSSVSSATSISMGNSAPTRLWKTLSGACGRTSP